MMVNYYSILGLDKKSSFTQQELDQAYLEQSKNTDINTPEGFAYHFALNEAYLALSSREKKAEYDRTLDQAKPLNIQPLSEKELFDKLESLQQASAQVFNSSFKNIEVLDAHVKFLSEYHSKLLQTSLYQKESGGLGFRGTNTKKTSDLSEHKKKIQNQSLDLSSYVIKNLYAELKPKIEAKFNEDKGFWGARPIFLSELEAKPNNPPIVVYGDYYSGAKEQHREDHLLFKVSSEGDANFIREIVKKVYREDLPEEESGQKLSLRFHIDKKFLIEESTKLREEVGQSNQETFSVPGTVQQGTKAEVKASAPAQSEVQQPEPQESVQVQNKEEEKPKLTSEQINEMQAEAFKKIYDALRNSHKSIYKGSDFLKNKRELTGSRFLSDVIGLALSKKDAFVTKAWELAQKYYLECTPKNTQLFTEIYKASVEKPGFFARSKVTGTPYRGSAAVKGLELTEDQIDKGKDKEGSRTAEIYHALSK